MRTTTLNLLLIAGLLLPLVGDRSHAYVVSGRHWATPPTWYINPLNNSGFSITQIRAALEPAMNGWCAGGQSNASCGNTYGGTTTGRTLANNGKNEVFFSTTTNGTAVGLARYYYNTSTLEYIDVDVTFYDTKYKFFTQTGCSSGIYLEDTAAHEFGHFLGMSHSAINDATMYANTAYCRRRNISLHADDIAGIQVLYEPDGSPPPMNAAPVVTISSPANASSHVSTASISFAATATDAEDGTISSSLQWTSDVVGEIGLGASFSRTLPVGVHQITASVTDAGGLNGSDVHTITVNTVSSAGTLSVRAWKNSVGEHKADLTWSNVSGTTVDIYRNGVKRLAGALNDGFHKDGINTIGTGYTYIYKLCVLGSTTTCTNEAAAVF